MSGLWSYHPPESGKQLNSLHIINKESSGGGFNIGCPFAQALTLEIKSVSTIFFYQNH
jgi:hypothetical protein